MDDIANKLKNLGNAAEAIKKIEGQTKDSNFDWSLLFPEKQKIHLAWLLASIALFVAICAGAIITGQKNQETYIMLFTAGLMSATWVSCCTHLRFDSVTITAGVIFSLLITLLVAGRVLTPSEGANKMLDQVIKDAKTNEASASASK